MPNRNRHRQSQPTNNRPSGPTQCLAVQVNPSLATVVVTAEILTAETVTCHLSPAEIIALRNQVKGLKKSNKKLEIKNATLRKDAVVDRSALVDVQVVLSDLNKVNQDLVKESDNRETEYTHSMMVEGAYTDFAVNKVASGDNESLVAFDNLIHPIELPTDVGKSPTMSQLRQLKNDDDSDSFARFMVQYLHGKGGDNGDGGASHNGRYAEDESLKMIHPNMVVQTAFEMTTKEYLKLGGVYRHKLARFDWCVYTAMVKGMNAISMLPPPTSRVAMDCPVRRQWIPILEADEVKRMLKVIAICEEMKEGPRLTGADKEAARVLVEKAVKSVENTLRDIWSTALAREYKKYEEKVASEDKEEWGGMERMMALAKKHNISDK